MNQNLETSVGTVEMDGQTWPTYSRSVYEIRVQGYIETADLVSPERLQAQLQAVLNAYGVEAKVTELVIVDRGIKGA